MTPLNTIIKEKKKEFEHRFCSSTSVPKYCVWKAEALAYPNEVKTFLTTAMQHAYEAWRTEWLRSEIEKLEGRMPTPPDVLIPSESPIDHALREGEYHTLTSIITRYKEELAELESLE